MSQYLRYKHVNIRKPHICFGCGRKFESKTKMVSAAYADGGTIETFYLCKTCEDIVGKMRYDDEFGYSDLRAEALHLEKCNGG